MKIGNKLIGSASVKQPIPFFIGVLCLALAVVVYQIFCEHEHSLRALFEGAVYVVGAIGAALVASGIITLLLHSPCSAAFWESPKNAGRILEKLSNPTLDDLLLALLKTRYKVAGNIADRDGYYNRIRSGIERAVAAPFCQNAKANVSIESEQNNVLYLKGILTYTITRREGNFPPIKWIRDKREFVDIEKVRISAEGVDVPFAAEVNLERDEVAKLIQSGKNPALEIPQNCPCRTLKISIQARYCAEIGSFQYWQTEFPVKNITFSASFGRDFDVQFKGFLFDQNPFSQTRARNAVELAYGGWIIPESGITWAFRRRSKTSGDN